MYSEGFGFRDSDHDDNHEDSRKLKRQELVVVFNVTAHGRNVRALSDVLFRGCRIESYKTYIRYATEQL